MYIQRTLEKVIKEISESFKVILLTGPRQVGKTTLLEHLAPAKRTIISLDELNIRAVAIQNPASFIEQLQLPALIDEAQYAPDIFPYIKLKVDQLKQPGLFWLTGSQQFNMIKNISESLAGRVVILQMQGISLAEEQNRTNSLPFLPTTHVLQQRMEQASLLNEAEIFHKIWRGSYPDMVTTNGHNWERFYNSYITTYIQRDVRDYLQINDPLIFYKFMQIAASRTGQLLNYKDIANDVGISEPTVKSWFNVLHASGIIYLLQPYFKNQTKRLIKTPKLYFMDTGLCCFLTGWLNANVLTRGAMAGALLETYTISEIIKSYYNNGQNPRIYFYRDKEQKEIDLLIEQNGVLFPVEIKKTSSIKNLSTDPFAPLKNIKTAIGHGGILCFVNQVLPLSPDIDVIPLSYI